MRTAILGIATAVLLVGCGPSADPEEVDAIAVVLRSDDSPLGMPVTEDQAECLARIYLESGLSDEAISRLKDGQPLAPATEDDAKAVSKLAGQLAKKCV